MSKNNRAPLQKQKQKTSKPRIAVSILAVMLIAISSMAVVAQPSIAEARKSYRYHWDSHRSTSKKTKTSETKTSSSGSTSTPAPTPSQTPTTTPTQTPAPTTGTATVPFASSLVGYWKLNGDATSALGKDNGKAVGNVTYVDGKFGKAAHFDGKSYIEIADQDYFSPSTTGQKMTVSFWFKPDTYNFTGVNEGYVNFMGKSDWSNGSEWEFRLDNETAYDGFSRSERMNFYTFNKGGGLGAGSALNKACPLNTWTHVVGEVDGTKTKLYINGKLVDSDLLSDYAIKMSNTNTPLRIGTSDKDSYLQGSISNVMIFNRALSDAEVLQLSQTDLR